MSKNREVKLKGYLTIEDATNAGYGSRSTLHRYMREDRLPSLMIGHKRYFAKSDLDNLKYPVVDEQDFFESEIKRIVAAAPKLTLEHRQTLITILKAGDHDA